MKSRDNQDNQPQTSQKMTKFVKEENKHFSTVYNFYKVLHVIFQSRILIVD